MIACGLDFGTSNSAIGVARDGTIALAPLEGDRTLMPSAVFFDEENRGRVAFGSEAVAAYVGQTEGRLMRPLKTILASPLIDETTSLGGRKVPLVDVVELFVRHLKHRAEALAGEEITAVVHGRPVCFVDDDGAADARAQDVLELVARRVGFRDVAFAYEPIAAAHDYEQTAQAEELVLIADIGGGTSDFSLVRIGPRRSGRLDRADDILATAGTRLGGTDFDSALSLAAVMPLMGLGTRLVEKDLPVPTALFPSSRPGRRSTSPTPTGTSGRSASWSPWPASHTRSGACSGSSAAASAIAWRWPSRMPRSRSALRCRPKSPSASSRTDWPSRRGVATSSGRSAHARTGSTRRRAAASPLPGSPAPRSVRSSSRVARAVFQPFARRSAGRRRRRAWRPVPTSCRSRQA